jgi:iduronate 2-sulfatase
LPQHFKNKGYYTISNGKVFHHMDDMKESRDENWRPRTKPTWRDHVLLKNVELEIAGGGSPWEAAENILCSFFSLRTN